VIKISTKAQLSYVIKPMTLVVTIVLLVFLLQSLYKSRVGEKVAEKNLDIVGTATNILLILADSKECLAYDDPLIVTKSNILDVEKLNSFKLKYQEIEPECARNYEFGWGVSVKQISKDEKTEKEWDFGAKEFSNGKSLSNQVEFWIPVAIRYSEDDVRLGKMEIKLVDGELERLSGFFDWSCNMGKMNKITSSSTEIYISQPVSYENGELCIQGNCRKLICDLVYFDGFASEGVYRIEVNYQEPNRLLVGK